MAKVILNSALREVRGAVGDWVYKKYSYGTVVTRRPRMGRIKPSRAQKAHREKVKAAAAFYHRVLADPVLKRRYAAIARKKRIPLPAVTLAAFFKTDLA